MTDPMTDLYTSALAAIEARRELVQAGTAGPWRADLNAYEPTIAQESSNWPAGDDDAVGVGYFRSDARLIVAAANAFASDTDALAAVLERHAPDPEQIELMLHVDSDEPCEACDEGSGHMSVVCRGCYPTWEDQPAHSVWPCSDAKNAMTALGVIEP